MGFFPASIFFEGALLILWFWFAILSEPTYFGRGFGMILSVWFFGFLVLPQFFYTDSSGTCCSTVNLFIPVNNYRILLSAGVGIMYASVIQLFDILDRDMVGRSKRKRA